MYFALAQMVVSYIRIWRGGAVAIRFVTTAFSSCLIVHKGCFSLIYTYPKSIVRQLWGLGQGVSKRHIFRSEMLSQARAGDRQRRWGWWRGIRVSSGGCWWADRVQLHRCLLCSGRSPRRSVMHWKYFMPVVSMLNVWVHQMLLFSNLWRYLNMCLQKKKDYRKKLPSMTLSERRWPSIGLLNFLKIL